MYNVNGAFGEVRFAIMELPKNESQLFFLKKVGWHKCNDLYGISRPHGRSQHTLLYTVDGCGEMCVCGKNYKLLPGSIAFIPRNESFSFGTPKGGLWEFYWLHLDGSFSERFLDMINIEQTEPCNFSKYDMRGIMEELISLCLNKSADNDIKISGKLSEVLHYSVLSLLNVPDVPTLAERVVKYINEHFNEKITNETIAKHVFISENHLIRIFKSEMGCTPHKYLINYRISMGKNLLISCNMSIDEIAFKTGFSSSSQFIGYFKNIYGCTPNKYREDRV